MTASPDGESTPAARAASLTAANAAPRPAAPAETPNASDDDARPNRRPWRTAALLGALVAVLAGLLWIGWHYTQSQYYVGVTDEGYVAVFKGVPGSIAGFSLSEVDNRSGIKVDALTQVAQDRVRKGIAAGTETEAQQILSGLTSDNSANPNLLPTCTTTAAPSASASASAPATSATPADSVLTPAPCRS